MPFAVPGRTSPRLVVTGRRTFGSTLIALGAAATTSSPFTSVLAQQGTRSADTAVAIEIAPGPLREVLERYSAATAASITVKAPVDGLRSPGVRGTMAAGDGLARLLEGTGLVAVEAAGGHSVEAAGDGRATTTLAPVVVTGKAVAEAATGPVVGYKASRSATATRIDVALQDQPVSVVVIPAEVIADQGVRNTTEVADYVAGVARETTEYSPYGQSFFIRGFSTYGSATTLNGFRQDGFLGVTDTSAIERIEFLKGPAAVLYGASSAISGLVNTVTKRPLARPFAKVDLSGGQFGYLRAAVDANHSLGSPDLLGRVDIAAERDDGFRSYPGSRANTLFAITPIVTARLTPDTRAELELSAIRTHYGGRCDGTAPELLFVPWRKQVVCDDLAHASLDTYTARAEVEHRVDSRWSLRIAGFFARSNSERTEQYALNDPIVSADGRTIERYTQYVDTRSKNATGQVELKGTLQTGPLAHRLLVGLDLTRSYGQYAFFDAPVTPMDLVDTTYDGQQLGPYASSFPANSSTAHSSALYAQDFVELGPRWKLLLGLRHDRVVSDSADLDTGVPSVPRQDESANSPRVGVVYQPVPATSLYASWARSFAPNTGARDRAGGVFPAERGTQYEAGIKQELAGERLNVTATVFDMTRRNVLTADPSDPTGNSSVATGEQRSRGAEVELVGTVLPGWSVLGAYTYLDAKVTEDNTIPVGQRLVGAARHSGSLWNKVSLGGWGLERWSAALGIVASGDRQARLPNIAVTLGGYVRFDAGIYWVAGPWRAQLNVKNLANRRIFTGQGYDLVAETPRAVTVNVGYRF